MTGDQVYLFVLTRVAETSGVDLKTYALPIKRQELVASVEKFRQRLANRDLDYSDSAVELYKLLIGRAQEQLHSKITLVIVSMNLIGVGILIASGRRPKLVAEPGA